jgi:hypothetical protein
MSEIRAAMDQARTLQGLEDTEDFALQVPGLLARLVQYLDLYVGHEPTLAEEEAHVRGERRAELLRAVVDRLANRATLYGDSETVNAVMYDLTAVAENEAQLSDSEIDAAPDYKAAVSDALRLLEAAPEAFQAAPSQNITAAAHVLRQAHEGGGGK